MGKVKLKQFKWLNVVSAENTQRSPDSNTAMTPAVEITWSLLSFSDQFDCFFFTASECPSSTDRAAPEVARVQGTEWLLLMRLMNNSMVANTSMTQQTNARNTACFPATHTHNILLIL